MGDATLAEICQLLNSVSLFTHFEITKAEASLKEFSQVEEVVRNFQSPTIPHQLR
ncbi:MAG: hypothetical protein KME23_26735 [Goleter apudmare HA4340-LM2]|jgi:hypothetical protein|nr:hypothetical protein [Goleter apudmare HA4340-LM2]